MATQEITKDNFRTTIESDGIVFLDFWASWCGPCRAFAPTYEKAANEHKDIVFGTVDTEEEQELSRGFNITSIPTLVAFRDGIMVYSEPGAMNPAGLDRLIEGVQGLDMDDIRAKLKEQENSKEN